MGYSQEIVDKVNDLKGRVEKVFQQTAYPTGVLPGLSTAGLRIFESGIIAPDFSTLEYEDNAKWKVWYDTINQFNALQNQCKVDLVAVVCATNARIPQDMQGITDVFHAVNDMFRIFIKKPEGVITHYSGYVLRRTTGEKSVYEIVYRGGNGVLNSRDLCFVVYAEKKGNAYRYSHCFYFMPVNKHKDFMVALQEDEPYQLTHSQGKPNSSYSRIDLIANLDEWANTTLTSSYVTKPQKFLTHEVESKLYFLLHNPVKVRDIAGETNPYYHAVASDGSRFYNLLYSHLESLRYRIRKNGKNIYTEFGVTTRTVSASDSLYSLVFPMKEDKSYSACVYLFYCELYIGDTKYGIHITDTPFFVKGKLMNTPDNRVAFVTWGASDCKFVSLNRILEELVPANADKVKIVYEIGSEAKVQERGNKGVAGVQNSSPNTAVGVQNSRPNTAVGVQNSNAKAVDVKGIEYAQELLQQTGGISVKKGIYTIKALLAPRGTVCANCLEQLEDYQMLVNKFGTGIVTPIMYTGNADKEAFIKDFVQSNRGYMVVGYKDDSSKCVVLQGMANEMWTVNAAKIKKEYTILDTTESIESLLQDVGDDIEADEIEYAQVRTKPSSVRSIAVHVPVDTVIKIETGWGTLICNDPRVGGHGNGDYLLWDTDENGKPKGTPRVVNNTIFKQTYIPA